MSGLSYFSGNVEFFHSKLFIPPGILKNEGKREEKTATYSQFQQNFKNRFFANILLTKKLQITI
jgi:hypothetical protein